MLTVSLLVGLLPASVFAETEVEEASAFQQKEYIEEDTVFASVFAEADQEYIDEDTSLKTLVLEEVNNSCNNNELICELFGVSENGGKNNRLLDYSFDSKGDLIEIAKPLDNRRIDKQYSITETEKKMPIIANKVATLFNLDYEYQISKPFAFDENRDFFCISKELENGIINDYQSVKMCMDMRTLELVVAHKFNYEPNTLYPDITKEEAIRIANSEYEEESEKIIPSSVYLSYVRPEKYCNTNVRYKTENSYLAYMVEYDNGSVITVVDAVSGEVIGHDMLMGDGAKCFVIKESPTKADYNYRKGKGNPAQVASFNRCREDNLRWAQVGFARLGYSVTNNNLCTGNIYGNVKNWIRNQPNAYALYINCHGSRDHFLSYYKAENIILKIEDVVGNWHFVYLDACNTAIDTAWAEEFNIYGYSRRAYLGWSSTVLLSNTHEFNSYFWDLLNGTRPVQDAAVRAADRVPGQGTTPIRFWGDNSYNGRSWS